MPEVWTPNRKPRPAGVVPRLIVLHSTIGSYRGAVAWLRNPESGVSSHYVIAKDGRHVKLAPLTDMTFHAGRSKWNNKLGVNSISIGIEMEHFDQKNETWPTKQLEKLVILLKDIHVAYGKLRILGHADICLPPGRKTDPRQFPWELLGRMMTG